MDTSQSTSEISTASETSSPEPTSDVSSDPAVAPSEPKPSYVKLAMRNMVRKRGKSLQHFALTAVGLLSLLIGLSYLTR